jgi:hypothetical protein
MVVSTIAITIVAADYQGEVQPEKSTTNPWAIIKHLNVHI